MGRDGSARLGGGRGWVVLSWVALSWIAVCAPAGLSAQSTGDPPRSVIAGSVPATEEAPRRISFAITTTRSPVTVDGKLDDPAWVDALAIPVPFEVSPGENEPAPVATECLLTQDEDNLYLGCRAADPSPDAIRAYVVDRDGIDGHDRVVLTVDPFNDQRRAFQFGINALGVQSDAVLAQQGAGNPNQGPDAAPIDPSWDAIWASAGTITDEGYVVEAAIPFRSLRFPTGAQNAWGVYLTRWWPRSSNVEIRSATWDRSNSCLLCQGNLVSGIDGGAPGLNVQLTPTLTAARTDTRPDFPNGPMVGGSTDPEVGVDAQWGLTSDLTLNLTANPDFSQVEADVAQLDVNNRFALFFPEKRPFFLEGADFFGTPIQAVFTRSISDPIGGAKVTGKLGSSAVGVLVARDRTNNLLIPGSQFSSATTLDSEVTTAVARFRRDVGSTSTVGALYTGREGSGYHNRVGGFDAFYRPFASLTLQGQALRSSTRYPTAVAERHDQSDGAFAGTALATNVNWTTRNWLFLAGGRYTEPDFRADAGFLPMAGTRGGNMSVIRRWWGGSDKWYTQLRMQVGTWRNQDFDGNQINGGMWIGLQYSGPGQTSIGIWPNILMKEHFAGTTHDGMNLLYFDVRTAPTGSFALSMDGDVGDAIDFANERLGSQVRFSPEATLRLGRNVEASLSHTFQRLAYQGEPVFTANLSQVRAVYNFSPRSYFRAIVQYQQTDRELEQYVRPVDESSRSLFTQLLYAYKLNPQTVFFLGYSEDGRGLVDPDRRRVPLTTQGRTFFLKLGYAWRP